MSISKKKRFEVFKRDSFTCQYCGSTPPKVVLEADHIQPKSKNGSDDINNLVTSCFDCNRGKSKTELSSIPESLLQNIEAVKEKELQYKEFKKLTYSIKRRKKKEAIKINEIYSASYNGWELSDRFVKSSLYNFLDKLGYDEVEEAAFKAFSYMGDCNAAIKYFCGICWNKIKKP